MQAFILLEILGAIMVYSSKKRLDIYRSINCLCLSLRGMYCLAYTDVNDSLVNTCTMYITYTLLDLILLLLSRIKRPELLLHHAFTIYSYIHLASIPDHYYNALISHIFLLAETLSIFNALLRGTIWLVYWRMVVIIFIRMPIWMYMIYIHTLLDQSLMSQILYKSAGFLMPLLDLYFLKKLKFNFSLVQHTKG